MHPTAYKNCEEFKNAYHDSMIELNDEYKIIEIGSKDINGSLRPIFPPGLEYIGVDLVEGDGVDVILEDPYKFPFEDESADVIVCNSVFHHVELFWVLYLEIMRILKPHGLFYLNIPSNGDFTCSPIDCWRFYPDSGDALVTWGKRNGINSALLESYVSGQNKGIWNDFVAVFAKDESYVEKFPTRILDTKQDFWNGKKYGVEGFLKYATISEDQKKVEVMRKVATGEIPVN